MPRPRKNPDEPSERPPAANTARPWGPITEILAADIAAPATSAGRWAELWEDVTLRLERTGRNFALAIPFADARVGENACAALRKYADNRFGPGHIEIVSRKIGESRTIYIRRGEAYKKPANGNGHATVEDFD